MITLKRGNYSFYYYDCLHDIMRQGIYSKYIECEQCSRKDKCVVLRDINLFLKYIEEQKKA